MSNELGTQEKVTVQVAAKALGVSIKTVHRYLNSGVLTKIKDGQRVYIPADEIRNLRRTDGQPVSTTKKDTITLDLSTYNDLLTELGQYKEQAKFLLEYKAEIKTKDEQLVNKAVELDQARNRLRELEEKYHTSLVDAGEQEAELEALRIHLKKLEEEKRLREQKELELREAQDRLQQLEQELGQARQRKPWWRRLWRKELV